MHETQALYNTNCLQNIEELNVSTSNPCVTCVGPYIFIFTKLLVVRFMSEESSISAAGKEIAKPISTFISPLFGPVMYRCRTICDVDKGTQYETNKPNIDCMITGLSTDPVLSDAT